ncbi:MAG: secretin N-terminal domain-containing protein [Elusimicrobiota bacterium]|jgi:type IV pilus assembly protein PilQ
MKTTVSRVAVKKGTAALMTALLTAQSAAPAWAQRRKAEPEANPSFQEDVQKPARPVAGGPIEGGEEAAAERPAEANAESAAPAASEPAASPYSRPAQDVQIGAAPKRKSAPAEPTDPLETRIVVRVKSAPLATFLDTISAQAKVNFIITEGLEDKRITAFLQNVTVREALQILLEIKGLTYQRIGRSNTYVVSPRAKGVPNRITRIYTLSHIPLMATDGGTKDFSAGSMGAGGMAGMLGQVASAVGAAGGPGKESEAAVATIFTVLSSVLTKDYGKVAIDARTNSLIITDIPEVFPQVEQILAELDKKAPQVMIEAQIVEIDSDRSQQLGIEWGGTNGELATFTGPLRDTTFPLNLPKNLTHTHFFDPVTNVVSGAAGASGAGGSSGSSATDTSALLFGSNLQTGILDLTQLKVVLRALVTRAEARFLGKPKILTLNNKTAIIQIAQNQAVSVQTVTTGSNAGVGSSGTQAERIGTGLKLNVTPQVNKEGYITMLVEPSFTNVAESKVSSASNRIFDPLTRGASTLVRVKNGQTLVLGGLLESRETKSVRKVPFLGYIPLIGWLFTSVSNQRSNTDLVIFVTPTIVND